MHIININALNALHIFLEPFSGPNLLPESARNPSLLRGSSVRSPPLNKG